MPTDDRFVGRKMLTAYQSGFLKSFYTPETGTTHRPIAPGGCYFYGCIPHPPQSGYWYTSEGPIIQIGNVVDPLIEGYELIGLAETDIPEANGSLVGLVKQVAYWGDPDHTPHHWDVIITSAGDITSGDNSFHYIYSCWLDDVGEPPIPPKLRFALSARKVVVFNYPVTSVADVQLNNAAGNTIVELPSFNLVTDTPFLYFEADSMVDANIVGKYGVCVFCLQGLKDLNVRRFTVSYNSIPNQFLPILPNTTTPSGGPPAFDNGGGSYRVRGVKDILPCVLIYSTENYNIYLTKSSTVLAYEATGGRYGLDTYYFVSDATTDMEEVI